jgi:hypothetical protein
MAQVVECLPSKHKALSSNSSTIKKKKYLYVTYAHSSHVLQNISRLLTIIITVI